jgi:antitoxin (DNA-binding transcriptional repressor) of toxin-antitoxin stability system
MPTTVNMLQAKSSLSRLVEAVESGVEAEIIIARNGKPAAKLVALDRVPKRKRRLGLAAGKYPPLDYEAFQALDAEVAALLYGSEPAEK